MKKIVVIPKEHIEYEQISGAGFDTIRFHLGNDKTLEVPETWEELLELCKKLNNKNIEIIFVDIRIIIHLDDDCEISFTDTFKDMWFKKKDFETRIKTDLTPQQMWQIIKNLMEK